MTSPKCEKTTRNQPNRCATTVKHNIDEGDVMSKIKDQMERDHEHEMEQYYSFMEWVCDQKQEVSEDVTNEEEEDTEMSSTARTSILTENTLKAANNISYNPNRSIK